MKTVNIPNRFNSAPVYTTEVEDADPRPMRTAVERAIAAGAVLTDAVLTRANLAGANLTRANLAGAVLTDADLTRANLTRANLAGAVLTDADLTRANLADANLAGANLTRANLAGAVLTDADLTRANLTRADLTDANLARAVLARAVLARANLADANLADARDDFRAVLDAAIPEVPGLLLAIREGRINGSQYEGDCACLVGTIGKLRGQRYDQMPGIEPNGTRPAERLFLAISPGHVPAINPVAKIVEGWILEWQAEQSAAAGGAP